MLNLSGFDVRFSYDSTKLQPSSLVTNEVTNDIKQYFNFEPEFSNSLNIFTISYDAEGNGIRAVVSFKPPVAESEHIIEKDGIGKVVNTTGGVLLRQNEFSNDSRYF